MSVETNELTKEELIEQTFNDIKSCLNRDYNDLIYTQAGWNNRGDMSQLIRMMDASRIFEKVIMTTSQRQNIHLVWELGLGMSEAAQFRNQTHVAIRKSIANAELKIRETVEKEVEKEWIQS